MSKSILIVGLATLLSLASFVALHHANSINSASNFDFSDFSYLDDFETRVQGFQDWTAEFNKQYSAHEMPHKFRVWNQNYDIVQEHNAKNLSWTLGMNVFADETREEFAALHLGFDVSKMAEHDLNIVTLDESVTASSVDWREKGAVTDIKNQGQCGGCWAFASAAGLEGVNKIKKKGTLQSFSAQQLIDCTSSYGNNGCNGGTMVATYKYTAKSGIEAWNSYTFTGSQGSCRHSSSKTVFKNKNYASVASYSQLLAAVSQQPVTVGVEADQSAFQMYKGGVISSNCGTNVDHAITAVGYTDKYWIVKNQWGASWGNKGYVYIARGTQNGGKGLCGINSFASYPTY